MKQQFLYILIALFSMSINASQKQYSEPDFAFPKQVSSQASEMLEKAVADGDGKLAVRALVNYGLAQCAVDNDSLPEVLQRISTVESKETDPCIKAMLTLLKARIYNDIYQYDRWKYDRREIPDTPLPDDYLLWSGRQFRARIMSLLDSALANPKPLHEARLIDFKELLKAGNNDYTFYPTLFDFIAGKAIAILSNMGEQQPIFAIDMLSPFTVYSKMNFNYQSPAAQRILKLYRQLLDAHAGNAAPFIMWDIERIKFISQHVYRDMSSYNAVRDNEAKLMLDLYNRFSQSEYAAEPLISLFYLIDLDNYNKEEMPVSIAEYYSLVNNQLKRYPEYFRNNALHNIVKSLSQPRINARYSQILSPGDTLTIDIKNNNTVDYTINVYRIPYNRNNGESFKITPSTNLPAPLYTISRKVTDKQVPFSSSSTEKVVLTQPGCYIVVPSITGQKRDADLGYYSIIHCTGLLVESANYGSSRLGIVINPKTGRPVDNATLTVTLNRNGNTVRNYETDKDGTALIKESKAFNASASKGTDRYSMSKYLGYIPSGNENKQFAMHGLTDLAIYHPGDTVQWVGILQSYLGAEARVVPGNKISVVLRDANYEPCDTAVATTDEYGRIAGSFKLPSDGLTGNFSIEFRKKDPLKPDRWNSYGTTSFTVSDYKLPTYEIEFTELLTDKPAKGAVTLKGKTVTYSGFPLADCRIAVDLSANPRIWWWRSAGNGVSFYSTEVTTDSEGCFSIEFPAELLKQSPIPGGIFSASLTATSPTGENQQASRSFSQGASCVINASLPADIDASKPYRMNVSLTNLLGEAVDSTITYQLIDKSDRHVVKEGTMTPPVATVDFNDVASGSYSMVFATADKSLADTFTVDNVNLYRVTDAKPPVTDMPIWLPVTTYTADRRHASILYGTSADSTWIHYAVYTDKALLKQGWIEAAAGMHHFDYDIPADADRIKVKFTGVNDYKVSDFEVTATASGTVDRINIAIESFRDKIAPGDNEKWTFYVTDNNGKGTKSAILLDMYAKALDRLSMHNFRIYPRFGHVNSYNISVYSPLGKFMSGVEIPFEWLKYEPISLPDLQTWGRSFLHPNYAFTRSNVYFSLNTEEEMGEEKSAAPRMIRGTSKMAATADTGAGAADLAIVEDEAVEEAADAESEAPDNDASRDNNEYRDAEMPLAFFRPMLTTDDKGNMTFSFTAPNANTTWKLCALAFTDDMLTSTMSREIISNKPVMVQPNLPRFLRTGDKALISASVMNNSDDSTAITTVVEIFDTATGDVISRNDFSDDMAPGEAKVVNVTVDAGWDSNMIGYRIKAGNGRFTDGEQSVIPVLSSVTPVIETKPFYISPDSTTFTMQLPEMPSDARVTLQFCENPVWYVATALPGLRNDDSESALAASAAIFSAAVADGILRTCPEIAEALKEWNSSDRSDSTLVSMLERNADLKTVLLNSTPWVMDAKSDTERMTRLSLLFDRKVINDTYSRNIDRLSKLVRNGGWTWIDNIDEPSQWITENVLLTMGHLKQLGFLPDNNRLRSMLDNAVKYIDRVTQEEYAKYPDGDYYYYVYLRDFYPDIKKSTTLSSLTSREVQRIVKEWKKRSIPVKAMNAITLKNHGYRTLATSVLASLNEYSVSNPSQGMWWPSLDDMTTWSMGKIGATSIVLDAFAAIYPQSPDVDKIRQWLILQKEAKDWGTSVTTSQAIASILLTGSKWTTPAAKATVTVNNREVNAGKTDRLLGYFRENISSMSPSGATLYVEKSGKTPSWGAVYCQYRSEMSEIKAASCPEVSIDKALYRRVTTENGVTWQNADSLKTGDIVQVNLTITVKRDMDYVAITDDRGACFEPVEQLPKPLFSEGICFYRENRDASTNMFVTHLPKGVYRLSYELYVNNSGTYSSGIATLQSQYAPALSAHSSGSMIEVMPQ